MQHAPFAAPNMSSFRLIARFDSPLNVAQSTASALKFKSHISYERLQRAHGKFLSFIIKPFGIAVCYLQKH